MEIHGQGLEFEKSVLSLDEAEQDAVLAKMSKILPIPRWVVTPERPDGREARLTTSGRKRGTRQTLHERQGKPCMSDPQATLQRLRLVWNHIEEVQRNCLKIAERLVLDGEESLAIQLVKNSLAHDMSKFQGLEWENLSGDPDDKKLLSLAIAHHNRSNPHHPEYWGSIKLMPSVYLAEMVADRSSDFGSSIQDWIDKNATKRFKFKKSDRVYKEIQKYLRLLIEEPFGPA